MGLELKLPPQRRLDPVVGRRSRGMSMIEVMVASLILLLLALGILPLFTRSMASNTAGAESIQVSNMASERAEELFQLPWSAAEITIPTGDLEVERNEVYTEEDGKFIPGTVSDATSDGKSVRWARVTRIRQFNVNNLNDPLPGEDPTNPTGDVHVKEIQVTVTSLREEGGPLGRPQELTVRLLKSI